MKEVYVSPYNFDPEVKKEFNLSSRGVKIADTTLKDGNQTPGVVLTKFDRIAIARFLDEIGIHELEAGMPGRNIEEKNAVEAIAKEGLNAKVSAWSTAEIENLDIVLAVEPDNVAVSIPTSEIAMKYFLRMSREEVVQRIVECIEYVKDHGFYAVASAGDSSRADVAFLRQFFKAAAEAGADRLRFADTLGVLIPRSSIYMTSEIVKYGLPVEIHAHNDYGLAVANSLAAVEAGVEYVATTVNGLGERAGNAPLEEMIMCLKKLYQIDLGFKTESIYELSKFVAEIAGISPASNKPIVGQNVFTHESGIHAHGVLSNPYTYESMTPEEVGHERRIIIGKFSGAHAIKYLLKGMFEGVNFPDHLLNDIREQVVKTAVNKGRALTGDELRLIVLETLVLKEMIT